MQATPNAARFVEHVRHSLFGIGPATSSAPPRIGAELELIPFDATTREICSIDRGGERSMLPFLRAFGARHGWTEACSAKGIPSFDLRSGARLTFEPGGQIEISTRPHRSVSALLAELQATIGPLCTEALGEGIELLAVGIDPFNSVADVPLKLAADRYSRMAEYFATISSHGARMMRQTAAMQVNIDAGSMPVERWNLLNALAPYLVAIFANSPIYERRETGHRSYRAHTWRSLDHSRTGLFPVADDPAREYADFALAAPDMMRRTSSNKYAPFREWVARGEASDEQWETHLSTLFPEVRPRGYFEIRSMDAVPSEWLAAPLAFISGLTHHAASASTTRELLDGGETHLLRRAGVHGLRDPAIARVTDQLWDLALDGCRALGPAFIATVDLDIASEFAGRFSRRARSPADEGSDIVRQRLGADLPLSA